MMNLQSNKCDTSIRVDWT